MDRKRKSPSRNAYVAVILIIAIITTLGSMLSYRLVFGEDKVPVSKAATEVAATDFSQYTEENPLNVVEIVPNIMYAEMGYQISGGEIFDYDILEQYANRGESLNKIDPQHCINTDGTVQWETIELDYNYNNSWLSGMVRTVYSLEYFKRYSLGMADYVDDELLKKQAVQRKLSSLIEKYEKNPEQNPYDAGYIEACKKIKNGNKYRITEEEQKKLDRFNSVKVNYTPLLVSEVNKKENLETYIKNADLIIFTSGEGDYSNVMGYVKQKYRSKKSNWIVATNSAFSENPSERLSWEAANYIFELSAVEGGVPVIMPFFLLDTEKQLENQQVMISKTYVDPNDAKKERKRLSEGVGDKEILASSNNATKLFLMLFRKDAIAFKEDYYRYVDKNTGNYLLQTGNAQKYWSLETFIDYRIDYYDGGTFSYQPTGQWNVKCYPTGLMNNGLVYNNYREFCKGGSAFNKTISISRPNNIEYDKDTQIYYNTDGGIRFSEDVVEYFGEKTQSITSTQAIQFLLAKRAAATRQPQDIVAKSGISVLEIEPSNEFTLSETDVRTYLNGYTGNVAIDTVTSLEFNGTQTDLAGSYDLIYLGDNTGGLSKNLNDSAYSSMIYMHTGDLAKLNGNKKEYYSGNDFIQSKKTELIEYANAKLPIIVADNVHEKNKVDKASNVYALLEAIESKENVVKKSDIQYKETMKKIVGCVNKERPEVSKVTAEYSTTKLEVSFRISGLETLEAKTQTANLYADLDGDGKVEEALLGSKKISKDGTYKIVYTNLDEAAHAVSYKLVVQFNEGEKGYTTVSGMANRRNASKNLVRVLQIMPEMSTIDLANETGTVGKKIIEVGNEYPIQVSTIKVEDFMALYNPAKGGVAYNEGNILTNHLINYDVIVLGFSDNYPLINNENGAVDNVITCISQKKAVIFTNSVLQEQNSYPNDKTKQAYDSLRELAGMKRYVNGRDTSYALNKTNKTVVTNGYTYTYLNNNLKDSKYSMFDYSDVTDNGFASKAAFTTTAITKVNDGMVSVYPYDIAHDSVAQPTIAGQKKTFAMVSVAKASGATWQLDMTSVVGFYALNNPPLEGKDKVLSRLHYSTSPNDIQNNYYLYHCGNVWYSGIGQTSLTGSHETEAELFVNTLVGAYTLGAKSPTVEFVDVTTTSTGESFAFVDADVFSSNVARDKAIKFVPSDPNKNSSGLKTTIYVENGDQLTSITKVYKEGTAGAIDLTSSSTKLASGQQYHMVIDKNILNNASNLTIYVFVENKSGIGMAKCQLRPRKDFSLD